MTEITLGTINDLTEGPHEEESEPTPALRAASPKWAEVREKVVIAFAAMPGAMVSDGTKQFKVMTIAQVLDLLTAVEEVVPL